MTDLKDRDPPAGSLFTHSKVLVVVRETGFHHWAEAPDEVEHLRVRHRHTFTFRVEWPISHDKCQVEFHTAQYWIRSVLVHLHDRTAHGFEFGSKSCETLARELCEGLIAYGAPYPVAAEVWEDDENGARVELPHVERRPSAPVRLMTFGGS